MQKNIAASIILAIIISLGFDVSFWKTLFVFIIMGFIQYIIHWVRLINKTR